MFKLPLDTATAFKDHLLNLGYEKVWVDRVSGVMKFKSEDSIIWVDRYFPDEDLTITMYPSHCPIEFHIAKWISNFSQKS